ncbi:DNA-processing protein DprA [Paenibacillus sp. J22TS3]|uniref:DNA-processing protein DprA n=1 Tax=Paenibacillus sp. J22TS3 TaxID=2807192 RepID=UPI001B0DE9E8|nr:DNA-processing protein DprA [Paenibacillus sp. J22TS3]GIP21414.1 DNA processing protein DprA [Paenibacillus sp. J22TS3]
MKLNRRRILLGLHESAGLGWRSIEKILLGNQDWEHAAEFSAQDWVHSGLTEVQAKRMTENFSNEWMEQREQQLRNKGIDWITCLDEDYPMLMKESGRPPWVMYLLGRRELLSSFSIAMVGTRVPTAYGRKVAEQLAADLCHNGVTVVSGLARGIDGVCHESALRCGGPTIAVLGTAIDKAYPPEHSGLYQRVAEKGLIVSEYPIGTPPHPGLFPQRNRIIAGLTRGTLVVEADARSGSLITADAAMEANRDVFAVPGQITSPKSCGTLNLIKQGAKMVTSAQDILEEYGRVDQLNLAGLASMNEGNKLTEPEQRIYHMLEQGSAGLDALLSATGWDFGLLHSVLLSLIIKKQVVQLPGSIYKLI